MNNVKTVCLLGGLTGLLLLLGELLGGGIRGAMVGLVLAVVMNGVAYFFSDRIVLAMYRARPLDPGEFPRVHAIVEELSTRAEIPKPALYLIPSPALNAFATGRNPNHASVAVTEGIVGALREDELRGVLAHELCHVTNRDILISTIAATLAGAITFLARMALWFGGGRNSREGGNPVAAIAMLIFAPVAAFLIQMAISRSREYQADASGARLAGYPDGLISALQKLESGTRRAPLDANPATAHMFIVMPFSGKSFLGLFQTHPPIEKRIERLRSQRP